MPYDEEGYWYEGNEDQGYDFGQFNIFDLPGAHLPSVPGATDKELKKIFDAD